jgi:hypothetical protein
VDSFEACQVPLQDRLGGDHGLEIGCRRVVRSVVIASISGFASAAVWVDGVESVQPFALARKVRSTSFGVATAARYVCAACSLDMVPVVAVTEADVELELPPPHPAMASVATTTAAAVDWVRCLDFVGYLRCGRAPDGVTRGGGFLAAASP